MMMKKSIFENLGRKMLIRIDYLGGVAALFTYSLLETLRSDKRGNKLTRDILVKQIFFTGYNAFPIISIIALLLGVVVIIQMVTALSQFGIEEMIGTIRNIVILRELGPILTAIIILGRSDPAIA
ncbi:MAG: ABC transporter permease, partial [bacterium]|nr:ABC transporter permease [bacterium]